jgi:hypothetical protein
MSLPDVPSPEYDPSTRTGFLYYLSQTAGEMVTYGRQHQGDLAIVMRPNPFIAHFTLRANVAHITGQLSALIADIEMYKLNLGYLPPELVTTNVYEAEAIIHRKSLWGKAADLPQRYLKALDRITLLENFTSIYLSECADLLSGIISTDKFVPARMLFIATVRTHQMMRRVNLEPPRSGFTP